MTYLVFDCRKATGYLFETRHKWLAHAFCVIMSRVARQWFWDYDNAMCFDPWGAYTMADDAADRAAWEDEYHGRA